jgi:hypothetical protein
VDEIMSPLGANGEGQEHVELLAGVPDDATGDIVMRSLIHR